MSIFRASLSVLLCTSLALPTVAWAGPPPPPPGGSGVQPEAPPDPTTLSQDERINWAKRLFKEAKDAHDREDYYNSVIRFEQAYAFAPDKHIFAFNIGQDAWELKDCARVKQYLELFLVKEQNNADLRKKAQELLQKAENNPECVTGGPAPANNTTTTSGGGGGGGGGSSRAPATDEEDPLLQKRKSGSDSSGGGEEDDAPKKRGVSGMFIGGVVLAVLGIGAVGGGIGTLAAAKSKAGAIEDAAAQGAMIQTFPQGVYNSDVDSDFNSLKTLNVVTPVLIGAGGALLVGGIVMIVIDRGNKKKGKGFYAGKKRVELTGLGASPLPGGGAAGSMALRF